MSKESKYESIFGGCAAMFFMLCMLILAILTKGEPSLLDAIRDYVFHLSENCN